MLKALSTPLSVLGALVLPFLIIIGSVELGIFEFIAKNDNPIIGACVFTLVVVSSLVGVIVGFDVMKKLLGKFIK